jgi:hypothetical protein
MTDRTKKDPVGAWAWVKGPAWWREMPAVWKAMGVIAFAFMAGVTTWATFSTQFGLPAVVATQGEQLQRLDDRLTVVESLPARLQEESELLRRVAARLDSLCFSVADGNQTTEDIRCVLWAQIEGRDPNIACSPLRPRIVRENHE